MTLKHIITTLFSSMYIAFGLGSLPELAVTDGGMFVISIYDHKPKVDQKLSNNKVFLFSIEL